MLRRLRSNFRLSIITLLGACAVFGITPFAVWRFMRGDILVGVVDMAILAAVVGTVICSWRTGDTTKSGLILALVSCSGGVTIATLVGEAGLLWLYPAFMCTFFLTLAWVAAVINLSSILFLIIHGAAFASTEQIMSFIASATVVSACSFAFARRNESQHQQLEQLARLDPLTGVKNRRAMDEQLLEAVAMHGRNRVPYALAMLDLDHFKTVNDTYGHSVGDDILMDLVRLIEGSIRRTGRPRDSLFWRCPAPR